MRAVRLSAYGNPVEGLGVADVPEPKAPGANEVLVAIEYSPINPNDLLVAQGIYPLRPELPSVIGNEGVGRVLAVGPGVTFVAVGDRVVPPRSSWVWRERMVIPAGGLFALPPGADPRQLAMLTINPPTASLLLSDYVDLNRGDVVVQNAANSGVGRWVIAFARSRGLRTVNIVRRAELVADLKAAGGDVVVVDGPGVAGEIKKAVGSARIPLALDGVSGPATGVLASLLSPGGTLVAYATMSGSPTMVLDSLAVIFTPITVKGFFMGHPQWERKIPPAIEAAARLVAEGVKVPVAAVYQLSEIKRAVEHTLRGGKVLLDVAGG
jgi:NADPH:quinone reductase-like Zn-dependent oxidoreductase